jgi:hypothetical protein
MVVILAMQWIGRHQDLRRPALRNTLQLQPGDILGRHTQGQEVVG